MTTPEHKTVKRLSQGGKTKATRALVGLIVRASLRKDCDLKHEWKIPGEDNDRGLSLTARLMS